MTPALLHFLNLALSKANHREKQKAYGASNLGLQWLLANEKIDLLPLTSMHLLNSAIPHHTIASIEILCRYLVSLLSQLTQ